MPTNPTTCSDCGVTTYSGDHVCIDYNGPACQVCGAGTTSYTVGAPGYGSGLICANGHDTPTSQQGILTPAQTV